MAVTKRNGIYYVDFVIEGHRVFKSARTRNKREALALEARLRAEKKQEIDRALATGAHLPLGQITIDQMLGRYWLDHARHLAWSSEVARYGKAIVEIIGDVPVSMFDQTHADHLVTTLRQRGMGAVAINRALSILRGAHNMAHKRWGYPTKAIDWKQLRNREPGERVRWLSKKQAAQLLAHLPPHSRLIVEFALYTGLRRREILNLTWDRVFPDERAIEVRVKGGKVKRQLLGGAAWDVLERAPRIGDRVFDATNLRKNFAKALKLANITDFRFHDLRHTFGTWLRQKSVALEVVRRAMNHVSIQSTMRYAHVHDAEVRNAAKKISKIEANVIPFPQSKEKLTYFITDGCKMKVGRSTNPQRSLARIAKSSGKSNLRIVGATSAIREYEAHKRFSNGARGEWFDVTPEILAEVEALCRDENSRTYVNLWVA